MAKVYVLALLVLTVELSQSLDYPSSGEQYNGTSAEIHLNSGQFNFSAFTNLISLRLYTNSELNLSNLSGLENLHVLNLTSNQISKLNLTNLQNLETLDLTNNSITNLTNFQFPFKLNNLNLTLNKLSFDSNVTFPLNLTNLNMSNNNLTIAENVYFTGRLKKLDLRSNRVSSVETFGNLTELEELYLSNNNITELNNQSFSRLFSLILLDLSRNRIADLTGKIFTGLCHLQTLDLSDNLLLTMEPGTFQYVDNLITLKLGGNAMIGRFATRHNSMLIETGQRLQTLDVTGTNVTQIPVILTRSVRHLFAAGNSITTLQCGDLDSYPLLQVLDLTSNAISVIEDDALGRLEFLTELYLSKNSLKTIPRVLPDNLKLLDANSNKIDALTSSDFIGLSGLNKLILSWNSIQAIKDETFGQLVSLEYLDLSGNPIKILPSNIFIGPRRLKCLILTRLHHLLPTQSPLSFPVPESGHLETLNLSSTPVLANQLLDDVAALTMFHQLLELDLSDDNLTQIRSDLLQFLPRLKKLNLNGNTLNCTNIIWLSKWFQEDQEEVEDGLRNLTEPICYCPNHLKGRSLLSLSENDFPEMSFTVQIISTTQAIMSSTSEYMSTASKSTNREDFTTVTTDKTENDTRVNDTVTHYNKFVQNIKNHNLGKSFYESNRTLDSTVNQTDVMFNVNKTLLNVFKISHRDNQFLNLTLKQNTSVLVISNAGKTDAFSAQPTSSHPGMFVFITVLCLLIFASAIMMISHWTQYRKRKELTRGYVQQQDIEVQSLSSAGINDLW